MQRHTIEIFQKASSIAELRFFSPEGVRICNRELSLQEIDRFAARVEEKYRISKSDPLGSFPELGKEIFIELYKWLDDWLAEALNGSDSVTLHINSDVERLRQLPWELLRSEVGYLCSNSFRLFTPARLVVNAKSGAPEVQNRPLRMLFMACSPENVKPSLEFETEEQKILESAEQHQIILFAEESGTIEGLRYQLEAYGRGYFDILHLNGHADVNKEGPFFIMEDDRGMRRDVTAGEIAAAFQEDWPRLVFLSGCKTGLSPEQGQLPSFCEALARAGAPAVLGWAQPVSDVAGYLAAGELYGQLAAGKSIDEAVARTRLYLFQQPELSDWHLLRLYTNGTPPNEIVTAPGTEGRAQVRMREAANVFLDAGAQTEICTRENFVGRRRVLQRCMRTLQSIQREEEYAEGVLIHGMGGIGKSSLAARLCERLPGHKRVVLVGTVNELGLIKKISDALNDAIAIESLKKTGLTLKQRLRNLFAGSHLTQPIIFVLDDFEQNLEATDNGYVAKPEPLEILESLLASIRESGAESRVIVTSRYEFPLPPPLRLRPEGLETLRGGELVKKLAPMKAFASYSSIKKDVRERAKELGAGNPQLLEWLDKLLMHGATDAVSIMDAMKRTAEEFREKMLIRGLLDQLSSECRRWIALASVCELPFDRETIAAAAGGSLDPQFDRAVSLGLVERGIEPATGAPRYFISRIVSPLVEPEVSGEEKNVAAGRAAKHLYLTRCQSGAEIGLDNLQEIFRLASRGREPEITREVGRRITTILVDSNRYLEVEEICQKALSLIEDHVLFLNLARVQEIMGRTEEAFMNCEKALSVCPDSDVAIKSGLFHIVAAMNWQMRDDEEAVNLWQHSLALLEQIGDIKGIAATLINIARVYEHAGLLKGAMDCWRGAVALYEQIDDNHGKASTLSDIAETVARKGDIKGTLDLWRQPPTLSEQIGEIQSKAVTLSHMAEVIAQQGDVEGAADLWQRLLEIKEHIADIHGKAATLHQIVDEIAKQGDVMVAVVLWHECLALYEQMEVLSEIKKPFYMTSRIELQKGIKGAKEFWRQVEALGEQISDVKSRLEDLVRKGLEIHGLKGDVEVALGLWQTSLALFEQIGDVRGKAATFFRMAGVIEQQGNVQRALDLWQESLALFEQIGDVKGKAATLSKMAVVIERQGNVERALDFWQQSLTAYEQIGDSQGKATALHRMARNATLHGDAKVAFDLWKQSLLIEERIGDVQGKVDTLDNMAGALAKQGRVQEAFNRWEQSLALKEKTDDVKGRAATLRQMAEAMARQGNFKQAFDFWQRSLLLCEQIGDDSGQAVALYHMGWMAARQNDFEEAKRLFLGSANRLEFLALAYATMWPALIGPLSGLSSLPIEDAPKYLAQAVWLTIQVKAWAEDTLNLIEKMFDKLGVEDKLAPLLGAAALFIAKKWGKLHPEQEKLIQRGEEMLRICAKALRIESRDQFREWFASRGLNDPRRFLPELSLGLESMVRNEEWIFKPEWVLEACQQGLDRLPQGGKLQPMPYYQLLS